MLSVLWASDSSEASDRVAVRALWSGVQLLRVLIVYVSIISLQSATDRGWGCVGGLLGGA